MAAAAAAAALALRAPALARPLRAAPRGYLGTPRWPPSLGGLPVAPVAPAGPAGRAMAGHNRWSKVRNVKGPRDAERSRLWQKMARMLRAAAREGGPEPSLNPELAAVVAQCRSLNVPKATIEGALRSARVMTTAHPELAAVVAQCRSLNVPKATIEGALRSARLAAVVAQCRSLNVPKATIEGALRSARVMTTAHPELAAVVAQCRSLNVPKATIEGALRSARERPAGGSQVLLTARGPGGSLLLLDVRTDNVRRSQAELRTLLGRYGASLTGDVRHAFEAVGVVRVSGRTLAMEAALELAAAAGAQDVVAEDEAELKFLCDPSALGTVRQHLVAAGLRPLSAAVEFVPRSALALPDGPRAEAERLLRALAEWPDVVRLFHNIQDGPAVTPGGHSAPAAPPGAQ
ncbi:translational activator of cytochrome c oxidase 1 [Vidua chalybeata]|uniref:translational activator of cytochrome c oxidase 1 n=1 Tax=Vidua chalybeata TaxID=81927 RepID=UPI0023A810AB|nr:translational activator of cytochrome c oxidase 1 [Vidua chalybeata]